MLSLLAQFGLDVFALILTLAVLAVAYLRPRFGSVAAGCVLRSLEGIARRRRLAVALPGALVLILRTALLPVLPVPVPWIHDEYSNILAGQTFAKGRLTNPPHPMWRSLETHIVLQHPTYASYRPPGPGLFLALGERLGSAWIGVLLSTTLFCSALTWALQAWTTRLWALLGGVLSVFNLGVLSYWTNSYWGGSLAAAGGALIVGSLPRLARTPGSPAVLSMAAGIIALLLTRPYEGAVLTAASLAALLWLMRKSDTLRARPLMRLGIPLAVACIALVGWTAYYNKRITGSWTRSPYVVGLDTYHEVSSFLWDRTIHWKHYENAQFALFFNEWEVRHAKALYTWLGLMKDYLHRGYVFGKFFIRAPFVALVAATPLLIRRRRLRPIWLIAGLFAVALLLALWFTPHYVAPATVLLYILIAQGLRALSYVRGIGGCRLGPFLPAALVTIVIATSLTYMAGYALGRPLGRTSPMSWCCVMPGNVVRARMIAELDRLPGKHLVLVKYPKDFHLHREWVYNEPDVDNAKIVWARSLGGEADRELMRYFYGRRLWTFDVRRDEPRLTPYTPGSPGFAQDCVR